MNSRREIAGHSVERQFRVSGPLTRSRQRGCDTQNPFVETVGDYWIERRLTDEEICPLIERFQDQVVGEMGGWCQDHQREGQDPRRVVSVAIPGEA